MENANSQDNSRRCQMLLCLCGPAPVVNLIEDISKFQLTFLNAGGDAMCGNREERQKGCLFFHACIIHN